MPENDDPRQPWNNPQYRDNPTAPHNDPRRSDSPWEPWNRPTGKVEDLDEEDRRKYGRS